MYSHHIKYDNNFNVIKYIQKDSFNSALETKEYDSLGRLLYFEINNGEYIKNEYIGTYRICLFSRNSVEIFNKFGKIIFQKLNNEWNKLIYYSVTLDNNCQYTWNPISFYKSGSEYHYDFLGDLLCANLSHLMELNIFMQIMMM